MGRVGRSVNGRSMAGNDVIMRLYIHHVIVGMQELHRVVRDIKMSTTRLLCSRVAGVELLESSCVL